MIKDDSSGDNVFSKFRGNTLRREKTTFDPTLKDPSLLGSDILDDLPADHWTRYEVGEYPDDYTYSDFLKYEKDKHLANTPARQAMDDWAWDIYDQIVADREQGRRSEEEFAVDLRRIGLFDLEEPQKKSDEPDSNDAAANPEVPPEEGPELTYNKPDPYDAPAGPKAPLIMPPSKAEPMPPFLRSMIEQGVSDVKEEAGKVPPFVRQMLALGVKNELAQGAQDLFTALKGLLPQEQPFVDSAPYSDFEPLTMFDRGPDVPVYPDMPPAFPLDMPPPNMLPLNLLNDQPAISPEMQDLNDQLDRARFLASEEAAALFAAGEEKERQRRKGIQNVQLLTDLLSDINAEKERQRQGALQNVQLLTEMLNGMNKRIPGPVYGGRDDMPPAMLPERNY